MIAKRHALISFIKLYADLSKLEAIYAKTKQIDPQIIKSIVSRLRRLNIHGSISWRALLLFTPLEIYINNPINDKKSLVQLVRILRSSLEKVILSKRIQVLIKNETQARSPKFELYHNFEELYPGYIFRPGEIPVLITVPHAVQPLKDIGAVQIATKVAENTHSYLLLPTDSRVIMDYNRMTSRLTPFRRLIEILTLREKKVKLILDIHTSPHLSHYDLEIGILSGTSSRLKLAKLMAKAFDKKNLRVSIEKKGYVGGDIPRYHAFVPWVNIIQVEVGMNDLRQKRIRSIISGLSEFITVSYNSR